MDDAGKIHSVEEVKETQLLAHRKWRRRDALGVIFTNLFFYDV